MVLFRGIRFCFLHNFPFPLKIVFFNNPYLFWFSKLLRIKIQKAKTPVALFLGAALFLVVPRKHTMEMCSMLAIPMWAHNSNSSRKVKIIKTMPPTVPSIWVEPAAAGLLVASNNRRGLNKCQVMLSGQSVGQHGIPEFPAVRQSVPRRAMTGSLT